jgi:hypothetical protein
MILFYEGYWVDSSSRAVTSHFGRVPEFDWLYEGASSILIQLNILRK